MKILGIETSCDETAASIVEDGTRIRSNVVVSQIDIHAAYGGVIPEVAARSHIEAILPVIHQAILGATNLSEVQGKSEQRKRTVSSIQRARSGRLDAEIRQICSAYDAIAVTHTPGLNGSLLIGTLTARTLALLSGKPLYPTHHLKSHIYANWLENPTPPEFPLVALVISGGHTQLIYMQSHNHFQIIGTTLDDAVGEAFDKAAKILGLPYPGGPSIASAASKATDPSAPTYKLPIPKVAGLDFSFSGLKTALLRAVQSAVGVPISTSSSALPALLTSDQQSNFAASFQSTAIKILQQKLQKSIETYHPRSIVLGGGVSANQELRKALSSLENHHAKLFFPEPKFCGDNAAMVSAAAHFSILAGTPPTSPLTLEVSPHSQIH